MGIQIGDVLRIDVLGTLFNQQIVTTFAYRNTTASTSPSVISDETNIAGDFKAGAITPFLAFLDCCPPDYNADQVRCQVVYPVRYKPGINNVDLPGTNAGGATKSSNQAATITRGGVLAKRSAVGSLHIPGLAAANMLDGKVTDAFLAKMSIVGSRMLNIWTVPSISCILVPVLINPARKAGPGGVPPARPFDTQDLYYSIPQRTARVMRRRTIGVGK